MNSQIQSYYLTTELNTKKKTNIDLKKQKIERNCIAPSKNIFICKIPTPNEIPSSFMFFYFAVCTMPHTRKSNFLSYPVCLSDKNMCQSSQRKH